MTAFVEVAHLAEGDIDKLARAYSAAKDAIGDNVAAQNLLEEKLLQVSEGEAELAQNIKKRATEQQNATTKSDAQTAAMARLGIEMELINQKMSKGGKQLADDFRKAIPEMKKAAKSADDFKRALAEAFDTNIANARTQEDFKAIQKSLEDTGAKTSLTNEHLQRLSAGVQGGAEAVKKVMKEQADAAKAAEASTKTLTKAKENETTQTATNTAAQENNIRAKKQAAEANKQLAQSAQSAENAQEKQNASTQKNSGLLRGLAGMIDNGVNALKNMANTTEEAGGAWKAYWQHFRSGEGTGMMPLISGLRNTNERLKEQIGQFNRIKEAAKQAGTALGKTTATTEDLARAQAVLKQATGASIFGLIRMDNQTLDNLKAQIDSAKARLDDLAQSAKNTADSLEGELARLNGDDARAVEIENSKKLADLQEKLAEARRRNNSEEIAQLERALQLQRRINETKLAKTKSQNATGNETRQRASGNDFDSHIDPSAVADAWEGRIKQAEKEAVNRFATQLTSEAKRRAS